MHNIKIPKHIHVSQQQLWFWASNTIEKKKSHGIIGISIQDLEKDIRNWTTNDLGRNVSTFTQLRGSTKHLISYAAVIKLGSCWIDAKHKIWEIKSKWKISCFTKKLMKILRVFKNIHTYLHIHVYIALYVCMYGVCTCVRVCGTHMQF